MSMKDLWPPIMQELKEFQKIAEIEETFFKRLQQEIQNIVDDQFIQTATEKGIARRERMLKISPFADDTLETRRFRVLGVWNDKLPYTYRVLLERLNSLCGPDGYEIVLNAGEYSLNIKIELTKKRMFDEVVKITRQMVPANMIVTVELRYNQYFTFANFTHGQLRKYTHYQLRNEVVS
ncbi:MAG TPA: putative phage tail protein [Cytophagaceae bacterium]